MAVKTLPPQGVTWAISETQASTEGHQQIWDGPIGIFVHISLYIYICCTYTYILHTAHSLQQKGTRKRTRKSDENEVHFPRRPLRYGPKETTKIWASRGIAIWEDLSAYFTVLRLLEIDVLLPYFILPFFAVAQTWCCHPTRTRNMGWAGVHAGENRSDSFEMKCEYIEIPWNTTNGYSTSCSSHPAFLRAPIGEFKSPKSIQKAYSTQMTQKWWDTLASKSFATQLLEKQPTACLYSRWYSSAWIPGGSRVWQNEPKMWQSILGYSVIYSVFMCVLSLPSGLSMAPGIGRICLEVFRGTPECVQRARVHCKIRPCGPGTAFNVPWIQAIWVSDDWSRWWRRDSVIDVLMFTNCSPNVKMTKKKK